jgi:hypothetical protein
MGPINGTTILSIMTLNITTISIMTHIMMTFSMIIINKSLH